MTEGFQLLVRARWTIFYGSSFKAKTLNEEPIAQA
jgi:hypothetical protein